MHLVDEYQFHAKAGKGGNGVVRWRREKFLPKGGPNGGNGGKGGDVYVEAIRDIMVLGRISHKAAYAAEDGEEGGSNSKTGANGEDFTLRLPVGSVVTNIETGQAFELLREGERVRVLVGGIGGYGNEHFKSSTNQQPRECTQGKAGEEGSFAVELKLIADVGLVGLPNAGKTSLLNALTNAGAKVGAYPFTTLDPNLGVFHGYVIADVPGLIEGASTGKGLGHKFLRHISRTRILLHCISLERDTAKNDYEIVRRELTSLEGVAEKPEYAVLTKSDTLEADELMKRTKEIRQMLPNVPLLGVVSILDDATVADLGAKLSNLLSKAG